MSEHSDSEASRGISRRTVAKAMAWAVPVIAVAAPVPAYAASQGEILIGNGGACKLPGNSQSLYKGYALGFSATNPYDTDILVTIIQMTLNGVSLGGLQIINLDGCTVVGANSFFVPANTTLPNLVALTKEAGDSQAGTLTATYGISGGPGGIVTATAEVDAAYPIQGGSCIGFTQAEKECIARQTRVE